MQENLTKSNVTYKMYNGVNEEVPLVSYIIGVKNMEDTVGKTIESILNQDYVNKEIIVINDGSEDNTEKVLLQYPIKIINTENFGISNARNLGYKNSKGEFIAFTDADCKLGPQWTSKMLLKFNEKNVGLVGAHTVYKTDDNFSSILRSIEFSKRFENVNKNHDVFWAGGQGLMFRRNVLDEIGGFNPKWIHGEDTEISYLTHELGYKVDFQKDAITYHIPESGFWRLVKKRYRDSKAHVRVFSSHSKSFLRCKFISSWYFSYDMLILPILYAFLMISAFAFPISLMVIYFFSTSDVKTIFFSLFFPIWICIIIFITIFLSGYSFIPAYDVVLHSKKNKFKNFIGTIVLHHTRGLAMGLGLIIGIKKQLFNHFRKI